MILLVNKLAKKFPKVNFVFRPHPRQNIKLVKKRFSNKINNIKVEYKYTITPWIMSCDFFLHSGCSTVFEASILKKKIIYLLENNIPKRPSVFSKLGYFSKNVDEAEKTISLFLSKNKKYDLKKSKLNNDIIENSNDKNFSSTLCDLLNKIKFKTIFNYEFQKIRNNSETLKTNRFKQKAKEFILNTRLGVKILNEIDPNLLLTKSYKDKKFRGITAGEVKNLIDKFSRFEKLKLSFRLKKIDKDLYFIENKKN